MREELRERDEAPRPVSPEAAPPRATTDETDPYFVLDFCKCAIRDAIGLEDGLDAADGEAVLQMIANAQAARASLAPSRDGGALLNALVKASQRVGNDRARYPRSAAVIHAEGLEADARAAVDRHIASLERDAARMREALYAVATTQLDDGAPAPEMGDGAAADYFRAQAYCMAQDAFAALAAPTTETPDNG